MARRRRRLNEPVEIKPVPLEYYGMDEIATIYADGVIVQNDENGFSLSFFQTVHPIVLSDEDKALVKKVRTRCIGKFFIPPAVFKNAIEAFQRNFEKRNSKHSKTAQAKENEGEES